MPLNVPRELLHRIVAALRFLLQCHQNYVVKVTTQATTQFFRLAFALRESQPEKLRRRLSGDLDNIVLMALQKEPQRRYDSVEEFTRDIQRHLGHRPLKARPNTLAYRSSRFVRRHRAEVTAACLILIVMLAAVGYTARERRSATETARAELA